MGCSSNLDDDKNITKFRCTVGFTVIKIINILLLQK